MNAVLNHRQAIPADVQRKDAQPSKVVRQHRYDSPKQESLSKLVLEKHKVALRNLAK